MPLNKGDLVLGRPALSAGRGSAIILGGGGGDEPVYDATASAIFARMAVAGSEPDAARKSLMDALIVGAKADGWWDDLDVLIVAAAHSEAAGLINWAGATDAVKVGAPTFTVDRGVTPDGAATAWDTQFNPSTAAGKFVQDSCHLGAWHLTDLPNGAGVSFDVGNLTSRIVNSATSTTQMKAQSATTTSGITENYARHKLFSRTGATAYRYYNDGAIVGGVRTDASAAMTSFAFGIGRTAAAAAFGLNQCAIFHCGRGLDTGGAKALAMRNRFATFLTAIGAI